MGERVDHDRLFKELLQTFFGEFVELFFPRVYAALDPEHIKFLQQEVFTDVTSGDKHRVDVLVETRLKGEPGIILVHIENQASVQRVCRAHVCLFQQTLSGTPLSDTAYMVFTYSQKRDEPDYFKLEFPFMSVLDFHFHDPGIKEHNWRNYIRSNNPVAAALLSKMGYRKQERYR